MGKRNKPISSGIRLSKTDITYLTAKDIWPLIFGGRNLTNSWLRQKKPAASEQRS